MSCSAILVIWALKLYLYDGNPCCPWQLVLHTQVYLNTDPDAWRHLYSQSKSSVHDKLHELHSHFPPIAQRPPSINMYTSSCWNVPLVTSRYIYGIDRKKGHVQRVTSSLAMTIRNLYDYKTKLGKNMLMCLHLKVRHYDFNIKIYCICFLSYK